MGASQNLGVFPVRKSLVFLVALAIGLTACGGESAKTVVATVNGSDITLGEVEALSSEIQSGAVPDGQLPQIIADNLRNIIVEKVVVAAAEDEFGITASQDEVDAQYQTFGSQFADEAAMEQEAANQGMTLEAVHRAALQQVISQKLVAKLDEGAPEPTDDEIQQFYDDNLASLVSNACVKHILVATLDEANAAKARLDAGEDFATVASEVSTDTGSAANGGDLGCGPLTNYVTEFAAAAATAEIGKVTDPVASQYGYHLILVTDRTVTPLDEVRDQIVAQLKSAGSNDRFRTWIIGALTDADVSIVAKYGQWVTDPTPNVVPPTTAPATTVAP